MFSRERTNYPLTMSVDDDGDGIGLAVDGVAGVDPQAVAALLCTGVEGLVACVGGGAGWWSGPAVGFGGGAW